MPAKLGTIVPRLRSPAGQKCSSQKTLLLSAVPLSYMARIVNKGEDTLRLSAYALTRARRSRRSNIHQVHTLLRFFGSPTRQIRTLQAVRGHAELSEQRNPDQTGQVSPGGQRIDQAQRAEGARRARLIPFRRSMDSRAELASRRPTRHHIGTLSLAARG